MEIEIIYSDSLQDNANRYYLKSKKARKKSEGLNKAIKDTEKKLKLLEEKEFSREEIIFVPKRKKHWYEKFHWFFSSDKILVIGGRDARSNETVVKKYMDDSDLHMHADVDGASHCVIKTKENIAPKQTMKEAAIFAASFSRAWQSNQASCDVYSVKPEQVSKKTQSGETMGTGAFMIYGQRNWFRKTQIALSIGIQKDDESYVIVSGPESAIKKHSIHSVNLIQGKKKKSEMAKLITKIFKEKISGLTIDVDEIIKMLPNGGMEIKI